jgi:hypothetical protein
MVFFRTFDCLFVQFNYAMNGVCSSITCRFWKARDAMKNPWLKKNPWLSMWLSGANAVAGSARSRATAEGKRQAAVMMKKGASQMLDFWSGGLSARSAPKKKKRR